VDRVLCAPTREVAPRDERIFATVPGTGATANVAIVE
jgi:hypothetical protein